MNKMMRKLLVLGIISVSAIIYTPDAHALSAEVHVPEKYTDVRAGERFYFELEIRYPENRNRKDLRLEYEILERGQVVAKSKFLKAIETQASFMDYVVIPESAKEGLHEINIKINDYNDLNTEVSASFKVTAKDNELKVYFFIIVGLIVILGFVIIWEISRLKKMR